MQFFICIQKNYKKLEELLLGLVEHEISGASIIEGRGMGQVLCHDLPVFAHLVDIFPQAGYDSYLLLCVVEDEQVDLCFQLVEHICQDETRGLCFTLPIGRMLRFPNVKALKFSKEPVSSESKPIDLDSQ
jgi:nitrogen regulatory protein P-II 1